MSKKPHTRIAKGDLKGALQEIKGYQMAGIENYPISRIRRKYHVGIQRSIVPNLYDIEITDSFVEIIRKKQTELIRQSKERKSQPVKEKEPLPTIKMPLEYYIFKIKEMGAVEIIVKF